MSIGGFGVTSLIDLMCVSEVAVQSQQAVSPAEHAEPPRAESPIGYRAKRWEVVYRELEALFAATGEFYGAETISDALRLDLADVSDRLGLSGSLDSIRIEDVTRLSIAGRVAQRLASLLDSLSEKEKLILDQRLYATSPQTLEELGRQMGVTRERVRQLQKRLTRTLAEAVGEDFDVVVRMLGDQLGPVVTCDELDEAVLRLFEIAHESEDALRLAQRIAKHQLDYACRADLCLSSADRTVADRLRSAAAEAADDVGLINEDVLRTSLPHDDWETHFYALVEFSDLLRLSGHLAVRNTGKARSKAALLKIGRPATREEVAAQAGMSPDLVGGHLSVIPSVVRADKTRWALVDWVDEVYDGIPTEIIQRIEEDGGATSLQKLVEDLPERFGVSETSVRTYVATPQFVVRDGYVSLADSSSISLRDVDDVIDGRDSDGHPYWSFKVEPRYFDGYSLTGFPPELAKLLGCDPNGKSVAKVVQPPNCSDVTVIWRLVSSTGASLGYLREPLERLGAQEEEILDVVIVGKGIVEFRRPPAEAKPKQSHRDSPDDLLERIKQRRKVI
jgi:RNA polymerase sigma factor (sigma-70 family)